MSLFECLNFVTICVFGLVTIQEFDIVPFLGIDFCLYLVFKIVLLKSPFLAAAAAMPAGRDKKKCLKASWWQ